MQWHSQTNQSFNSWYSLNIKSKGLLHAAGKWPNHQNGCLLDWKQIQTCWTHSPVRHPILDHNVWGKPHTDGTDGRFNIWLTPASSLRVPAIPSRLASRPECSVSALLPGTHLRFESPHPLFMSPQTYVGEVQRPVSWAYKNRGCLERGCRGNPTVTSVVSSASSTPVGLFYWALKSDLPSSEDVYHSLTRLRGCQSCLASCFPINLCIYLFINLICKWNELSEQ